MEGTFKVFGGFWGDFQSEIKLNFDMFSGDESGMYSVGEGAIFVSKAPQSLNGLLCVH